MYEEKFMKQALALSARHPIDVDELRRVAGAPLEAGLTAAEQHSADEAIEILEAWAGPRKTTNA
jgi:hypothetical protein